MDALLEQLVQRYKGMETEMRTLEQALGVRQGQVTPQAQNAQSSGGVLV